MANLLMPQPDMFTSWEDWALEMNKVLVESLEEEAIERTDADVVTEEWRAPFYENSWVDIGGGVVPTRYKKHHGIVHLQVAAKDGVLPTDDVFTLPTGFRPDGTVPFAARSLAATGAEGRVEADGRVHFPQGSSVVGVCANISFPADQ